MWLSPSRQYSRYCSRPSVKDESGGTIGGSICNATPTLSVGLASHAVPSTHLCYRLGSPLRRNPACPRPFRRGRLARPSVLSGRRLHSPLVIIDAGEQLAQFQRECVQLKGVTQEPADLFTIIGRRISTYKLRFHGFPVRPSNAPRIILCPGSGGRNVRFPPIADVRIDQPHVPHSVNWRESGLRKNGTWHSRSELITYYRRQRGGEL